MSSGVTHPTVLWAQRTDRVLVSIQLDDVSDEQITVDSSKLTFSGKSHNKTYGVDFEFFDSIIPEESKQRKGGREYYFDLKKKDSGPYWPRLLKEKTKHQNLKVDFNRWKDEDDSDDGAGGMYEDASLESMMSQMGTGAGGPGGSFDPGKVADSDDSDDDDIPDLEDDAGKKVEE